MQREKILSLLYKVIGDCFIIFIFNGAFHVCVGNPLDLNEAAVA
jgi:hypothetical protein